MLAAQLAVVLPPRMRVLSVTFLFLLTLGLIVPLHAQTPKPSPTPNPKSEEPEIDPDDVISVNTTEVLLPVTVRDGAGNLVSGLKRDDFRVFEDGVVQTLSDLSLRQVPVDVVLMVEGRRRFCDASCRRGSHQSNSVRRSSVVAAGLDQESDSASTSTKAGSSRNVYKISRRRPLSDA